MHKIESLARSRRAFPSTKTRVLVRAATYSHFAAAEVSIPVPWISYLSQSRLCGSSRRVDHVSLFLPRGTSLRTSVLRREKKKEAKRN